MGSIPPGGDTCFQKQPAMKKLYTCLFILELNQVEDVCSEPLALHVLLQ